jgi:hypothetical protein
MHAHTTATLSSTVRKRRMTSWLGAVSLLIGLAFVVSIPPISAAATAKPKQVVHAGAYVVFTPGGKPDSLNGATKFLILKTPPLPAGNYLAAASVNAFIPEVLSEGSPDTNDFVECYINELPNKTSTFTHHYDYGYNGEFSMSVSDAFLKMPSGTQLGLYCYEYEANSGGQITDASLTVTPYSTISDS